MDETQLLPICRSVQLYCYDSYLVLGSTHGEEHVSGAEADVMCLSEQRHLEKPCCAVSVG